jgi:hypothetical protein
MFVQIVDAAGLVTRTGGGRFWPLSDRLDILIHAEEISGIVFLLDRG